MTLAQFAALKAGDRVVCSCGCGVMGSVAGVHDTVLSLIFVIWDDGIPGHCFPRELDLPDTETPPLFEEDGA